MGLRQRCDMTMADRAPTAPSAGQSLIERALDQLGRGAGSAPAMVGEQLAEVELALTDLVADQNGEIVVFNDSGCRSLAIRTDATVVANGRAGIHVTADGTDVTGFKYVQFGNGVTIYFEEGLEILIAR